MDEIARVGHNKQDKHLSEAQSNFFGINIEMSLEAQFNAIVSFFTDSKQWQHVTAKVMIFDDENRVNLLSFIIIFDFLTLTLLISRHMC